MHFLQGSRRTNLTTISIRYALLEGVFASRHCGRALRGKVGESSPALFFLYTNEKAIRPRPDSCICVMPIVMDSIVVKKVMNHLEKWNFILPNFVGLGRSVRAANLDTSHNYKFLNAVGQGST